MSLEIIKNTLEDHLRNNITTTAIKFYNTDILLLNGSVVDQDNQDIFIESRIVPITSNIDLINTNEDTQYRAFFTVDIYRRSGKGMGSALGLASELQALFKNYNSDGVVCENTNATSSFTDGDWVIMPIRVTCRYRGV